MIEKLQHQLHEGKPAPFRIQIRADMPDQLLHIRLCSRIEVRLQRRRLKAAEQPRNARTDLSCCGVCRKELQDDRRLPADQSGGVSEQVFVCWRGYAANWSCSVRDLVAKLGEDITDQRL